MTDRIIPLNCPACGSPSNEGLREHSFGGEIKCKHCGVTSVLVINNQWHQKKAGEYVCDACGRVARDGDRFCECSRALVRKCFRCSTEFFIGKKICPRCGANHAVDLTESGQTELAAETEKLVRGGQFAQAAPALRSLLASIQMSKRISPKAEAVLRELIFTPLESGDISSAVPSAKWSYEWVTDGWGVDSSYKKEWSGIKWAMKGIGGIDAWLKNIQNFESRLVASDKEIETTRVKYVAETDIPMVLTIALAGILFFTVFSGMGIGSRLVVTVITFFVLLTTLMAVERGWQQSEKLSEIRDLLAKREKLKAEMEAAKLLRG